MRAPFPLLAAIYSFFLVFATVASAQGRGEFPHAGPAHDGPPDEGPPSRTTDRNFNHPTGVPGRVNVGHFVGDNRIVERPAEPTGKHHPKMFPQHKGKNGDFSRMGGGHRISLKSVDQHPDRQAFAHKQQQQTVMVPPPARLPNSTNSTAGLMRRWTNPYKLPTTKTTKRSTGPANRGIKDPGRRARRRWFSS